VFGWHPGIGDPTIYGWLTVAAYALGALSCWWASKRAPSRERRFWLLLAIVMAFLCVNKQLDLQTFLTDAGRAEAKAHGWYGKRREYQAGFILALGIASLLILAAFLKRAKRASTPVRGAMIGLTLLLFFVLVRASSFNKMDWLINQRFGSLRANHLLEWSGIGLVTLFALAATRRRGGRRLAPA